jgi:membrane protease YdiL (CAAX protease family)
MSVVALIVASNSGLLILSVFVTLPPLTGLYFLLIIFVILIIPENRETKIGIPSMRGTILWFIFIIAAVGVIISIQMASFYISNLIQFGFLFFIPLLIVIGSTNANRTELGFSIANRRNIGWTVGIGALYGLLVWIFIGTLNFYEFNFIVLPALYTEYIPLALVTAIVFIVLAVAIPEEFLFRAILQPALIERYSRVPGIILSSIIFGLFHIPANFLMYLTLTPIWTNALFGSILMSLLFQAQIGLVFGVAYEWTKSLVMPISLHAVHDIIEMLPFFIYLIMGPVLF